jgi:hypothetical protein
MRPLGIEFQAFPALLFRQPDEAEYIDCIAAIPDSAVSDAV